MEVGYLAKFSEEEVKFASKARFACLELDAGPGSRLDAVRLSKEELKRIKDAFSKYNIHISALFSGFANHLHPDKEKRKEVNDYVSKLMDTAERLGVKLLVTNAWGDPNKDVEENLPDYKQVFTEYARQAEEKGIKIAIENCPHLSGYPYKIGNIAYSPRIWEKIFDAVPSEMIGLEFDPSHLVWLSIDYMKALYEFKDRIYSVHAKDTEIIKDNLYKEGILGASWWRYRLPGLGEVNWQKFIGALYNIGYEGDIIIEHEDPSFSEERRHGGLKLGLKHLRLFVL